MKTACDTAVAHSRFIRALACLMPRLRRSQSQPESDITLSESRQIFMQTSASAFRKWHAKKSGKAEVLRKFKSSWPEPELAR